MIDTISIRDYKSLRHIQVGLSRFTVIVGPNGSGKTSVLQAVNDLSRAFHQVPNILAEITQASSKGSQGLVEIAIQGDGVALRYRTATAETSAAMEVAGNLGAQAWNTWKRAVNNAKEAPRSVLLNLDVKCLRATRVNQPNSASMAPDGTGLHAALANIALNEPDIWPLLQTDLRGIIPLIKRIRHARVSSGEIPELLFDTIGADSLGAGQISEGTLLVLGLLTALYAPECPDLVLIDDLDRSLHPKAQKDLVQLLRRLLERKPELQIIATTDSPYLLDSMEHSEVLLTVLRDDGSTACGSLMNHPKFAKWKDEMAPGELWSLFGEKWVIGEGAAV